MTGQFLRTTALCGTITLACVGGPALAQSADEVTALRAQLAALSARLEALEGQQAQTAATVSSNTAAVSTIADNPPNFVIDDKGVSEQVVVAGETPKSFKIPGTNTDFRITGYAKADFIYDFDQDVGDFFVTDISRRIRVWTHLMGLRSTLASRACRSKPEHRLPWEMCAHLLRQILLDLSRSVKRSRTRPTSVCGMQRPILAL